jgi:hypothetical protein
MKTSIILRFDNLSEDDRLQICNWLLSEDNQTEIPFRVFYRKGGINNKMVECRLSDNLRPKNWLDYQAGYSKPKWSKNG